MNLIDKIKHNKDKFMEIQEQLEPMYLENYEEAFRISYTHNSTAIEGNSLTLLDTKLVLSDKVSVGGKDLREIYEVINHDKAYRYIKQCIKDKKALSETIVKQIHKILVENIFPGGNYRIGDVFIGGSQHEPPSPQDMILQMKHFYRDLEYKCVLETTELAAWTHAEFVRIHPFIDGNGRTARLLMNYQLMAAGFLPVSIAKEERLEYFETLEAYAVDGDLTPFAEMVASLEERRLDEYLTLEQQQGEIGHTL